MPETATSPPVERPAILLEREKRVRALERTAPGESGMKKFLGIFAVFGAVAAGLMFWRKRQDDDEFLDEELE